MSDAAAAETSLDLLAWRGALSDAGAAPSSVDLIDWARRLADAGYATGAALLADVAALHAGFSPSAVADRAYPFGRVTPPAGDDMPARVMAELRALGLVDVPGSSSSSPEHAHERPAGDDVATIVDRLHGLLSQPLADRGGELAALLDALASPTRPIIDPRRFAAAPLALLVPAIAAAALVDFARRTRDLWAGAWGSPELMHRVACFDPGGLGPYLANVGRLARGSRDVIAMARVAHDASGRTKAAADERALAPWIALLSRGCGAGLLQELVDDLGDAGANGALVAILERATSLPSAAVDVGLLTRLRDAALDNADYPVAVHAQRAIARLRPDSDLEGVILGSIEASAGERGAATATFRYWLARSPGHEGLRERLAALEVGRFERFAVARGYGSPADRQEMRLRRRGLLPAGPRRASERIEAVEVH